MNVFDLQAVLGLDKSEYDKGLDDAQSKAGDFGKMFSGAFGTAMKVGTAAVGAASVAVGKLATDAVSSYASYEQLSGGVEKLFGVGGKSIEEYAESVGLSVEEAQASFDAHNNAVDKLMQNADNAWQTAGMSANEYMETATSFSAALINSLGGDTEKAADMADVAMRAMSDNVNTFGSDAEAVSNAIMGLSRNNYTMIDNLKLGYAGTAEGMMKLVNDSGVLKDKVLTDTKELNTVGFATMIEAIQAIQEKQGIAGTTAREAMHTIEGSATATKKAWENVITAIGRGEGIDNAFNDLLTAVFGDETGGGLLENIIPRMQTVMQGIATFIVSAAPQLASAIPSLINAVFPSLLMSAISLVGMLAGQIPNILKSLLQSVIQGVNTILSEVSNAIFGYNIFDNIESFTKGIIDILSQKVPDFFNSGIDWIIGLLEGFTGGGDVLSNISLVYQAILSGLTEGLPLILEKGIELITFLINGMLENFPTLITTMGDILNQVIAFIMENLPMFLEKGMEFIGNMVDGIIQNLPAIFEAFVEVVTGAITTIQEHLPEFLSKGQELLGQIIGGIGEKLPELITTIAELLAKALAEIGEHLPEFLEKGIELVGKLVAGLIQSIPDVLKWVGDLFSDVLGAFKDYDWLSIGSNIIQGIIDGLLGGLSDIWDAATSVASSAYDAACDFLGIKSPSKLGRYIGRMFDLGVAEDIEANAPVDEARNAMRSVYDAAQGTIDEINIPMSTSFEGNSRGIGNSDTNTAVLQLLAKYLPMLANMQVVLQDRTVAGKLAPYMNEELGRIAEWETVI